MIKMANAVVAVLVLVLLAGVSGITTSCDDGGEAEMYAQMAARGGSSSSTPRAGSRNNQQNQQNGGQADQTPAELPGLADGEESAAAEDGGEPSDEDRSATLIPGIEIQDIEVKAPYPEFTGADRYNVKVTLVTESPVPSQVFRILAIGENNEVVGEQERDLRLPRKKAGSLHFNDWYCMSIPVTVEFHTTETQAAAAGEATGNVGEGRGGSTTAGLN